MSIKKGLLIIVILILLLVIWMAVFKPQNTIVDNVLNLNSESESVSLEKEMCYYKSLVGPSGMADEFALRVNIINEEDVNGILWLLPYEKDSKTGTFSGKVSDMGPGTTTRVISSIWDVEAEGMKYKEELSILYGEEMADVGFGEMVDNGDGIYRYADVDSISYSLGLSKIACADLDTKLND